MACLRNVAKCLLSQYQNNFSLMMLDAMLHARAIEPLKGLGYHSKISYFIVYYHCHSKLDHCVAQTKTCKMSCSIKSSSLYKGSLNCRIFLTKLLYSLHHDSGPGMLKQMHENAAGNVIVIVVYEMQRYGDAACLHQDDMM